MNKENEMRYRNTKIKLLIYTGIWVLLWAFGYLCQLYLTSTQIWYDWEPIYPMLHFLKENLLPVMLLVFTAGLFVILWYDYHRMKNLVDEEKAKALRLAEQSEQRKNDLVVYLAHDLKTPLTSILGYMELLQNTPELSEETKQKYMQTVITKAERLEDLLEEFFEITQYNLTQITLEKSQINLTRLLEQLIFEFQPMLQERDLTCDLQAVPDLHLVCDGARIQRVFDNLLKNAVHYAFRETVIKITLRQREQGVVITFANEGNTIPPEKLSHIFEQFFRLDSARGTKKGGAGIGLAIAKEIVELHGGSISAASEDNRIRFEVVLPVDKMN